MVLPLSYVCQITPHSRNPVCRAKGMLGGTTGFQELTSNGDSVDYAWEYAIAFRCGWGIGMTRLPQAFLSATCACLAGIGLPSRNP